MRCNGRESFQPHGCCSSDLKGLCVVFVSKEIYDEGDSSGKKGYNTIFLKLSENVPYQCLFRKVQLKRLANVLVLEM